MQCCHQADQAPEFCDGLVLARIVETLDHTRGGIAGLERNPTVRDPLVPTQCALGLLGDAGLA